MGVTIKSGPALYPLTSPPSKPTPHPPSDLIAKAVECGDREIIITIPFPDTVELMGEVLNELLDNPDVSGKSPKAIYKELDDAMGGLLIEASTGLPDHVTGGVNKQKTGAKFMIAYDPAEPLHRARLTVWRTDGADFGSWKIRFEFSPSKAGPDGYKKLTSGLSAVLWFMDIGKLIPSFRVSRIDAAIDCIGAYPIDVIAHIAKPGKRMVYVGDNGKPESMYLYEKKPLPKKAPKNLSLRTVGPHRLTLYERRNYQRQHFIQPTYGSCPVTRVEVSIRWKPPKQRPAITGLADIPNLFKGRRVAYAANVAPGDPKTWRRFCLMAFGGGADAAQFSLLPGSGVELSKAYRSCLGDLIDKTCWTRWADGLAYTGLLGWADAGQSSP